MTLKTERQRLFDALVDLYASSVDTSNDSAVDDWEDQRDAILREWRALKLPNPDRARAEARSIAGAIRAREGDTP